MSAGTTRGTTIISALMAVTAVAMLLPAAVGFTLREHEMARAFLYSATLLFSLAGFIFLATRRAPRTAGPFGHPFYTLTAAYFLVPVFMALPVTEATQGGLRLFDAWFEMVAAFTTTGATALPGDMPRSLVLWRALAGWLGGLFVLVYAMAILAPMDMGGFDIVNARAEQAGKRPEWSKKMRATLTEPGRDAQHGARIAAQVRLILPAYAAATLVIWVGLSIIGTPPLVALILAFSTLSTSGIVPQAEWTTGIGGEALIALFLLAAVTRRAWPGARVQQDAGPVWRDEEVRLAIAILAGVTLVLWAIGLPGGGLSAALHSLWGVMFTVLSFMTTTGFVSQVGAPMDGAFAGSGGIVLLGLAMLGGGVATTAGGMKLLRGYALGWQAKHELEKLVYPSGMGGDGPRLRGLRSEGAFSAWLFLMVFILTLSVLVMSLVLLGKPLEDALIFSAAALATTGPLVQIAGPEPLLWADLNDLSRFVTAFGMILGRLELLLLLSVLWPRFGR